MENLLFFFMPTFLAEKAVIALFLPGYFVFENRHLED